MARVGRQGKAWRGVGLGGVGIGTGSCIMPRAQKCHQSPGTHITSAPWRRRRPQSYTRPCRPRTFLSTASSASK
jgi:hypothetical protein